MKLIQKTSLLNSVEFELFEDAVVITEKSFFKSRKRHIPLAGIHATPQITPTELSFESNDQSVKAITLSINQPNPLSFDGFVNAITERILRLSSKQPVKTAINAYSQRLTPPFSGLVQIAESDRARALTMDGKTWEFQTLHIMLESEGGPNKTYRRRFSHAITVSNEGLKDMIAQSSNENSHLDNSLIQLAEYISRADFPFPPTDVYEYWLLDKKDDSPLAMIFSCSEKEQMDTFPEKNEWTALPAAAMPVTLTAEESENKARPVNIRVQEMIAERAGSFNARARWFKRSPDETEDFPPLMIREDWDDPQQASLCKRYLCRQASRLLMLHHLPEADRRRLEIDARSQVFEVQRFHTFYPEVIDQKLMNTILVEARLRENKEANDPRAVQNRRDGVLYL